MATEQQPDGSTHDVAYSAVQYVRQNLGLQVCAIANLDDLLAYVQTQNGDAMGEHRQRVHLLPGASQVVSFSASSASLRLVDRATGDVVSTPGAFDLVVTNGVREAARRRVVVEGDEVVVEPFPAGGAGVKG
jgi:hypothetical protein